MPDITMCRGKNCPDKNTCYRFTAMPDKYWQSYFVEIPFERYGKCYHYLRDIRTESEDPCILEAVEK